MDEEETPKKSGGCLKFGLVGCGIVLLLGLAGAGVGGWYGYNWWQARRLAVAVPEEIVPVEPAPVVEEAPPPPAVEAPPEPTPVAEAAPPPVVEQAAPSPAPTPSASSSASPSPSSSASASSSKSSSSTGKSSSSSKSSTPPTTAAPAASSTKAQPAPAAAPAASGEKVAVNFSLPSGGKLDGIEVFVDGASLGVKPLRERVSVGRHTFRFFKEGVIDLTCPIQVPDTGRSIELGKKATCPPISTDELD